MEPMHQVVSADDLSCAWKILPVKSAVATSLTGMTLRIVQNNKTLMAPLKRKMESLVDQPRVSETALLPEIAIQCPPEYRDGKWNTVTSPFTHPEDGDREEEDGICDLFQKDGFSPVVTLMQIRSRTGYKIICLATARAPEPTRLRPLQPDSSFSRIRKRTRQPVTMIFPLKRKNTRA